MKKLANLVFTLTAAVLLGVLVLGMWLQEHEEYSYYENRNLAELPEAQQETLLDGSWFTALEAYLCDHSAWREDIQPMSTWIDLNLLHRPMVNDVVVTDGVLLPYEPFEAVDPEQVREDADALAYNLTVLNRLVRSYGGTYCYVAVPCQYAYFPDRYPWYLNNRSTYTQVSLAALSDALAEWNVPFLDLGPVYAAEGWPEEYSSTVDNHFSIFGAYRAYAVILTELNRLSGKNDLPILREEELVFAPVDKYYMGSRTRKLFNLVGNDEKLYTAMPVEPVPFLRNDWNSIYNSPETVYYYLDQEGPIDYTMYMGMDASITRIETNRPDKPTVLIYGDSFTNALECILYLSCDTMYSIDLRHYTESTLFAFIMETKPDYVFCLRDYESLLSTDGNGGR